MRLAAPRAHAGIQPLANSTRHKLTITVPEDHEMADRLETETLLHKLYAARLRGDLDALCATFTADASFQIAGASNTSPLVISANGVDKYRPLLAIMLKSFKLRDQEILAMLVDGARAAVHWRVKIFSRITGTTVLTELVDIVEVRDGHVSSYTEMFVPR